MIVVRYAVCSETDRKPVTRLVCDQREEAVQALERLKQQDGQVPEQSYWIAELGPECEAWRYLAGDWEPPSA